ncbi:MAG: AIR synthase family protein [Clostridia bacterium]|nr:AIR synthase family protein [Clostridia bacterium]
MKIGKLENSVLEELILKKFTPMRAESKTQPRIGEDCAVLDIGDDFVALSSDPITSVGTESLGRLSVYVNCNDAVCSGADPVGLMVTLLVPPSATENDIDRIANDLAAAARRCNVDILGGHTEITDAVTRPITSTTVIARAARNKALMGAQSGDSIIMTKSAGLEGTGIIAAALVEPSMREICEYCFDNLSVVQEARIAVDCGAHALHDVTEGGILGAVWELATCANLGATIDVNAIEVLPQTQQLCDRLGLDPLRLIGSGSLLIACANPEAMLKRLQKADIPARKIGVLHEGDICDLDGKPIAPPESDELYKLNLGK